jgi:opacity protein-like surface antigen
MSGPGAGLPVATTGTRYLLLDSIGSYSNPVPAAAWGNLVADANDIVEFDGSFWSVAFESQQGVNVQFVTNITTEIQYRWTGSNNGSKWVKSFEGLYPGGDWSLVL